MGLRIHVIGPGTIGEPLIGLLLRESGTLGIEAVTFSKRTAAARDTPKVLRLQSMGAQLAVAEGEAASFEAVGQRPNLLSLDEALRYANVVVDCTSSGGGLKHKETLFGNYPNVKGFIAQGSENGFGIPYARGINDDALLTDETRFIQVVSCNTHNVASIVHTLAVEDGELNLSKGTFVCMRRANDVSQDGDFVPSPQVGTHKDARYGTHHAADAARVFQTLGYDPPLFSTAVKLPTQYMHVVYFQLELVESRTRDWVLERLRANYRLATTDLMTANRVFSVGRDHGYYGRIFNQAVVSLPTVNVMEDGSVVGYCFTPQDGNSILSTVAAILWFDNPETYEQRLDALRLYRFQIL